MKKIILYSAIVLSACGTAAAEETSTPPPEQPVAVADDASMNDRLHDLDAMTFPCPRAALNAAAREAAKAPSQGSYQFSYFNFILASYLSTYEVHFKSNYSGEPDLKYCVTVPCAQGQDPNTSVSIVRIGEKPSAGETGVGGAAPITYCSPASVRMMSHPKDK